MITSRGFQPNTNFILDIRSQIYSEQLILKGYEVIVKKCADDKWLDFYIPEEDITNPIK